MNSQNNNSMPIHNLPLPSEGSPESHPLVLDLCTRRRPISPDYTLTYPSPKSSPVYEEPPCSTYYCRSPKSISECSETSESPSLIDMNTSPTSSVKVTRPFKAFPKNPAELSIGITPRSDPISVTDSAVEYSEFRQKMLAQVQQSYSSVNKNMRRNQNENKKNADPSYLEKRRKNNEAAKRSRDARKAKEDEIAIRCAFLEQENMKLKFRVAALEGERERLQRLMYQ